MYRARAEAISGTNVYAGGKWLQCIGNKNVSVGDYIWTDGRCVYGNHYTPQQPLIITAPQGDEGMPIIVVSEAQNVWQYEYYTFSKGRLKFIGKIDRDTNAKPIKAMFLLSDVGLLSSNGISDVGMMINDDKGHNTKLCSPLM